MRCAASGTSSTCFITVSGSASAPLHHPPRFCPLVSSPQLASLLMSGACVVVLRVLAAASGLMRSDSLCFLAHAATERCFHNRTSLFVQRWCQRTRDPSALGGVPLCCSTTVQQWIQQELATAFAVTYQVLAVALLDLDHISRCFLLRLSSFFALD